MTYKIRVIDQEIIPKSMGVIILLENLEDELEENVAIEIERQRKLGASLIKLCDKSCNIDNTKIQHYIGEYEFNWYTDFYLMRLPCKKYENLKTELSLEPLVKEDVEKFVEIYTEIFENIPNSATYDDNTVLEMLEDKKTKIGFIKYKSEYIGFFELTFEDGEEGELTAIGILPKFRDRSLGNLSIKIANEMFCDKGYKYTKLLVASINTKAFELYKKMGFEIVGQRYSRWYHCKL